MRVPLSTPLDLTYCTNVHRGESWDEVRLALHEHVAEVKRRVCPDAPFGVGLRLGVEAVRDLEKPGGLDELREELRELGLYVFTLNGFPYGAFHGTRVKERVYRPDWREPERLEYTLGLARILAAVLPSGSVGSISTVPGCFRPEAAAPGARDQIADNLCRAAVELWRIEQRTGACINLALEPEPCCLLETNAEALAFFQEYVFAPERRVAFSEATGVASKDAEAALRRHLGVCLDACHAAVEFESPLAAFRALRSAGIAVPKIQVSAGLRLREPDRESLAELGEFADEVYLHQVVIEQPSSCGALALSRFLDLPDAFAAARNGSKDCEWRVHFHVPVFEPVLGRFLSTQDELRQLLLSAELDGSELEVETYTFGMLPERYRNLPVAAAVARELEWTLGVLGSRS